MPNEGDLMVVGGLAPVPSRCQVLFGTAMPLVGREMQRSVWRHAMSLRRTLVAGAAEFIGSFSCECTALFAARFGDSAQGFDKSHSDPAKLRDFDARLWRSDAEQNGP